MIHRNILFSLITSLENLQALNKKDLAAIHDLVDEDTLNTCAKQLARMAEELKDYEGKYTIGTMTPVGLITLVRKNRSGKIIQLRITNQDEEKFMTVQELKAAIQQKPVADLVKYES